MYMGQVTSWMSLPPYMKTTLIRSSAWSFAVQRYLAHKKTPTPLGPPFDPRHMPTAGS